MEVASYTPRTFRDNVTSLIVEKRYEDAIRYLESSDPIGQANFEQSGFHGVAEDLIVLPGVYPDIDFDSKRDWVFPGTSDAVENTGWQRATTFRQLGRRGWFWPVATSITCTDSEAKDERP